MTGLLDRTQGRPGDAFRVGIIMAVGYACIPFFAYVSVGLLFGDFSNPGASMRPEVQLRALLTDLSASRAYPVDGRVSGEACGRLHAGVGACLRAEQAMRADGAAAWKAATVEMRRACLERMWGSNEPAARLNACLGSNN